MKNNKDIVLIAVSQYGDAIEYASAVLQEDLELVLTAIYNKTGPIGVSLSKTMANSPIVLFLQQIKNVIPNIDWPIIKRALLEKPDYFLNPEPIVKELISDIDYPYLILAQYALNKDVIIEPEPYPELL